MKIKNEHFFTDEKSIFQNDKFIRVSSRTLFKNEKQSFLLPKKKKSILFKKYSHIYNKTFL